MVLCRLEFFQGNRSPDTCTSLLAKIMFHVLSSLVSYRKRKSFVTCPRLRRSLTPNQFYWEIRSIFWPIGLQQNEDVECQLPFTQRFRLSEILHKSWLGLPEFSYSIRISMKNRLVASYFLLAESLAPHDLKESHILLNRVKEVD